MSKCEVFNEIGEFMSTCQAPRSEGPLCKKCGKPRNYSRHILYGPDIDNPMKHEFEPIEPSDFVKGFNTGRSSLLPLLRELVEASGIIVNRAIDEGDSRPSVKYAAEILAKAEKELSE